jgi:hypothetical protein
MKLFLVILVIHVIRVSACALLATEKYFNLHLAILLQSQQYAKNLFHYMVNRELLKSKTVAQPIEVYKGQLRPTKVTLILEEAEERNLIANHRCQCY